MRARLLLAPVIALVIILVLPFAYLQWQRLVWVDDPFDKAASARILNSVQSKEMTPMPWGGFVVYASLEGGIEVTCKDGTVTRGGYVTSVNSGSYEIDADCRLNWSAE